MHLFVPFMRSTVPDMRIYNRNKGKYTVMAVQFCSLISGRYCVILIIKGGFHYVDSICPTRGGFFWFAGNNVSMDLTEKN